MKYPFTFKVIYWIEENKFHSECGFGFAGSYTEATHILEKRYGDGLCVIKHLALWEEDTVVIAPDEKWISEYEKNPFNYIVCDADGNPIQE